MTIGVFFSIQWQVKQQVEEEKEHPEKCPILYTIVLKYCTWTKLSVWVHIWDNSIRCQMFKLLPFKIKNIRKKTVFLVWHELEMAAVFCSDLWEVSSHSLLQWIVKRWQNCSVVEHLISRHSYMYNSTFVCVAFKKTVFWLGTFQTKSSDSWTWIRKAMRFFIG